MIAVWGGPHLPAHGVPLRAVVGCNERIANHRHRRNELDGQRMVMLVVVVLVLVLPVSAEDIVRLSTAMHPFGGAAVVKCVQRRVQTFFFVFYACIACSFCIRAKAFVAVLWDVLFVFLLLFFCFFFAFFASIFEYMRRAGKGRGRACLLLIIPRKQFKLDFCDLHLAHAMMTRC